MTNPDPAAVSRALFVQFPPGLQHALRLAATRNDWTPEDWTVQVDGCKMRCAGARMVKRPWPPRMRNRHRRSWSS